VRVHDTLLFLHMLAAFAVVATVVIFTALALRLTADSRLLAVGNVLWAIGGLGTLVFGIWLALYVQGYEIWDGWIIAAIVLWFVANGLGFRGGEIYARARELAKRLAAEGDEPSPELSALIRSRRAAVMTWASTATMFAILVLMVWKPGAP
jgi:uncharacterized membrane protein